MPEAPSDQKPTVFTKIAQWFTLRPRFSATLFVGLIGFGILSYGVLIRREGFPSIQVPIAVVSGAYFVNDPSVVDQDVAQPLSAIVASVDGVESVSTQATANAFTIVANLTEDTDNETATQQIENAVDEAGTIPESVVIQYPVFDAAKFNGTYDLLVSLYASEGTSINDLEMTAHELIPRFEQVYAVAIAEVEPLTQSAPDPITGQSQTVQVAFGQLGLASDVSGAGSVEFYPAITIGISGEGGEELDIFELSSAVEDRISDLETELPDGYGLVIAADFTDSVETQIGSLQQNVINGIIAVTIISALMIGWRVSILTAVFIIGVIFSSIVILYGLGYTLNTITLFGLVLSLGLFVDDATIIAEAIDAAKLPGRSRREIIRAAINGVGAASFAGTLTTVLVFTPLLFIGGVLGQFIFLLPLTVIIALLTSFFLSITLIPFLSRYTILSKRGMVAVPRWENPVPEWLAKMIRLLKTNNVAGSIIAVGMVSLSLGFIGLAGYFASQVTFNIFPSSKDSDEIVLSWNYPTDTTIAEATEIADEIGGIAAAVIGPELERAVAGRGTTPNERSSDLLLELTPFSSRDITSPQIINRLSERFSTYQSVDIQITQLDAGPPAERFPFKMQVYSEETDLAEAAALDIASWLQGRQIEKPNGDSSAITETDTSSPVVISRTDGKRYVEVFAAYETEDVSALVQGTRDAVNAEYDTDRLAELGLSADALAFDFGQESENEESFSALVPAGIIAVSAMFLLLAIQFRSVIKPLLIFLALPFSLFGVTYGLYISNNPFSFFAMVGFIGLIGIAVNNTILLTDYANQGRRAGLSPVDAIAEATALRFRPLFTTTATTIAALAPLAITDPFWEPLAITIMFGLLSSTILVILAFPYYYLLAEIVSRWLRSVWRRLTQRAI
jgi:multidrug efflux pump subunit AcrB